MHSTALLQLLAQTQLQTREPPCCPVCSTLQEVTGLQAKAIKIGIRILPCLQAIRTAQTWEAKSTQRIRCMSAGHTILLPGEAVGITGGVPSFVPPTLPELTLPELVP